jgi:hypothetical protein
LDAVDPTPDDGCCDVQPGRSRCDDAKLGPPTCTLRAAVQTANAQSGPDVINLRAGRYTLTIPGIGEDDSRSGDLDVREDLAIIGAGAATTIVDGGCLDRVLHVLDGYCTLAKFTIQNGDTLQDSSESNSVGGGINFRTVVDGGALTLEQMVIRRNRSGKGGGIYNLQGTLVIDQSTLADNQASQGGGIDNNLGDLTISNSTLAGNVVFKSNQVSPGIANAGGTILNSTIDSTVSGRCGHPGVPDCSGGPDLDHDLLYVMNSILLACKGRIVSRGNNILVRTSHLLPCTFEAQPNKDLVGGEAPIDPGLGPLQDNGGPTPTRALLPGSPALDRISDGSCLPTDQRGESRPQGGNCDVGAYEARSCAGDPTTCDPMVHGCQFCGAASVCLSAPAAHCDDQDPATTDRCDVERGCVNEVAGSCPSACGNGVTNSVLGEQCDEGVANGSPTSVCTAECQLRSANCGDGLVESPEQCDLGTVNSDSEDTNSCCSATCMLHPLTWACRKYPLNSCVETTMCRTGEAMCPDPIFKGRGEPCVGEDVCIFNSSCQGDGTCVGGTRLCDVQVREASGRRGLPKIKVRCNITPDQRKQNASCKTHAGFDSLGAFLTKFGDDIFAPAERSSQEPFPSDVHTNATNAKHVSACQKAAERVKRECKVDSISSAVFYCAADKKLWGPHFEGCELNSCGHALVYLGSKCPKAVRTGVLDAKVVTEITGIKIGGNTVERQDIKRCSNGVCMQESPES